MTDRIKISGAPRQYDEAELKQLQEHAHAKYRQSAQCLEVVQTDFPYEFITAIIEKSKLGYELSKWSPIITLPLDYSASMIKPPELQKLDLDVIDVDVKAQYIKELEAEREEYKAKLTQQLIQAAELKEQRREEEKRAKLLREIEKEVADTFAPLIIPD
ncbi:hypothetical protein [Pseudomonas sp. R37(2017)]|uniref:hypothetical protein n=1 Tax=Pseudomonas sp. R37(2017) TaxID=1981685 RepID=UPI000A1FDBA6|nr:hypothetical protein [Pseudomonas sp. R37(2017)]